MRSPLVIPGVILRALALVALLPATLSADEPTYSTTIVPLVGTVRGVGDVRWRSDVRIVNGSNEPVDVILELPTAEGRPWIMQPVGAGETLLISDIAREAFGSENLLSPLYVHAVSSRRPLTVLTVISGEGPAGAVAPQVPIANYAGSFPARQTFTRLAWTDDYRTNVGLVNLEETTVTVTLALQRVSGRTFATTKMTLQPVSLIHLPLQELFPVLGKSGDLILVAEFSSSRAYAYASVIRNDTHAGVFASP